MNKTIAALCGTGLVFVLVGAFVLLKLNGAVDDQFVWLTGLVFNIVLGAWQVARTEDVKREVNGRFSAQQEIARKALDVLPAEEVARIVREGLIPAPRQVDSPPSIGPRTDPPGSTIEPSAKPAS